MQEKTYQEHPIRATINSLIELGVDARLADPNIIAPGSEIESQRDTVFALARIVSGLLEETPSVLVTSGLSNLANNMQRILTEMTNFASNKNPGHLTNAITYTEQAASQLNCFLPFNISNKKGFSNSLIFGIQQTARQAITQVKDQRDQFVQEVLKLKEGVAEQEKNIEALSQAVNTQKADALSVVAQVNKEFAESERLRGSMFATSLSSREADYDKYSSETLKNADKLIAEIKLVATKQVSCYKSLVL
jgi:hypothetical protein